MFVETLRWRDTFKPEETLKETFPEEVFGKVGYVFGKDKEGRPVTYRSFPYYNELFALTFIQLDTMSMAETKI